MYTRSIAILLAISGTYASPVIFKRDTCSDACASAYDTCRSAPNANRSTCASEYAQCLGYSPFDNTGSLVTPTACSKSASVTSTSKSTSTAAPYCVAGCNTAYNTCRTAPDANRSTCASEYAQCLGYSPFDSSGSLVTPTACSKSTAPTSTAALDTCVAECNAAYNTCRTAPDANRATCAAEYSGCLGYLPFDNSGSLVTPTACSKSAAATPTITSSPKACASDCTTKYNACRSAPNANRATCASEYSECLGYAPFEEDGSLATPTACSGTAAHTSTATSVAASSVTGIPGGCNPAHPGSCPTPAAATADKSTSTQSVTAGGWTVKGLTRYCAEDGSGCDYNFGLSFADGSADTRCTIVRLDVPNALTESWFDQPCDTGSDIRVSWGYSTQFDTPFAVMTVVKQQKQAYFGVNDPNGQEVTAGNPSGSGSFGDIGPQPVYSS